MGFSMATLQLEKLNQQIADLRAEQAAALTAYRQQVAAHVADIDRQIARLHMQHSAIEPDFGLTDRERMIIRCLINGVIRGDDIAAALGISERTVRTHLTNIYQKTELPNKTALTLNYKEWWA